MGNKPALILLHHIEVAPADAKYWDTPPLSGEIKNNNIYGRGSIDTKGLAIALLSSFLALKNSGRKLNRDVSFMATTDEEAGGFYGAGWLLENRPEIFEREGYLVKEGGSAMLLSDISAFNIEVTKKAPLWLRLTATDTPGHGSTLQVKSSVKKSSGQVPELPIPNSNEEPYPRPRITFLLTRLFKMISAKR